MNSEEVIPMIKNAEAVYDTISTILVERQQTKDTQVSAQNNNEVTEQLKKYKELLDAGVITKEEFDVKKKQLLDI